MKDFFMWLISNIYLISVWGMAAFLIYSQTPGWGWFLACAFFVLAGTTIKINCENKEVDK